MDTISRILTYYLPVLNRACRRKPNFETHTPKTMKTINAIKADSHRPSLQESTRPKPSQTFARRTSRFILAISVALCASSAATQAQTWETVDDIDAPSAKADGITADSVGNVFVAGSINDTVGITHAVVMKSSDQGDTWVTADDVTSATSSRGAGRIASARIAVSGNAIEDHLVTASMAQGTKWLIRRSVDAGAKWATLDLYIHPNPQYVLAGPPSVALDGIGNIYAVGSATETVVVTSKGKTTTSTIPPAASKTRGRPVEHYQSSGSDAENCLRRDQRVWDKQHRYFLAGTEEQ